MRKLAIAGFCLALVSELIAMLALDRQYLLIVSGVAVGFVLLVARTFFVSDMDSPPADSEVDTAGESLHRWLSRTETMIHWSESTQSDWDRHLRPILARQFEMATNQRHTKDSAAFHATGQMLFGDLWRWVDPQDVQAGGRSPGPGRAALDEILQRLELL